MNEYTKPPWGIAPETARYKVADTNERKRLESLGVNCEFDAISIGNGSGTRALIPLDESSREIAEFINTACNAHDDLLKALEGCLSFDDSGLGNKWYWEDRELALKIHITAKAAIKKAKGDIRGGYKDDHE